MSRRLPLSVYLPSLTSLLVVAGLCGYYLFSVSLKNRYYDERAFRVLSLLDNGFSETVDGLRAVFGASTKYSKAKNGAYKTPNEYLETFLLEHNVRDIRGHDVGRLGRTGILRLSPLKPSSAFTIRAVYMAPPAEPVSSSVRTVPASLSATVDLGPVLDRLFDRLGDDFFDDVVVADAQGTVWYQQAPNGNRIADLAALIAQASPARQTGTSQSGVAEDRTTGSPQVPPRPTPVGSFSKAVDVPLAGPPHRLYPLSA